MFQSRQDVRGERRHARRAAGANVRIRDLRERLDGKHIRDVALPGLGAVAGFGGRRNDSETFYSFTSYTVPGSIYRYNAASGQGVTFREPKLAFDQQQFETKQVFYTSRDGTRVPLTIVSRRNIKLDGKNPMILYGYGGFNISLTPAFSVGVIAWLEQGGVYAVPNLRGGGEYGRAWHEAGMLGRKQNVFDDFLAAAEWLIAQQSERGEQVQSAPQAKAFPFPLPSEGLVLDDVEMSFVRQALQRSNGNQTRAAELLGISRDQLRYRLKKLEEPLHQD